MALLRKLSFPSLRGHRAAETRRENSREEFIYSGNIDDKLAFLPFLAGEKALLRLEEAYDMSFADPPPQGPLHITNYRIYFFGKIPVRNVQEEDFTEIEIPLAAITKYKLTRQSEASCTTKLQTIKISAKPMRVEMLGVSFNDAKKILATLKKAIPTAISEVFAFKHVDKSPSTPTPAAGSTGTSQITSFWEVFSTQREYITRQKVNMSIFRLAKNTFCSSYPTHILVPRIMNDQALVEVAKGRTSNRFPLVTWQHPYRTDDRLPRPTLSRSAALALLVKDEVFQITVMVNNLEDSMNMSKQDRKVLAQISKAAGPGGELIIVDVGVADDATGDASVNAGLYREYKCFYLGMGNVQLLEEAFQKLSSLCIGKRVDVGTTQWDDRLEATGWPRQLRKVIYGCTRLAKMIEDEYKSVHIQSMFGGGLTNVVMSTLQLMLDPYYRTVEGLAVLIDKEWTATGFRMDNLEFDKRAKKLKKEENGAVFFMLFLDICWQLWQQTPQAFQFDESLLHFLAEHAYSYRYGNWAYTSDKERNAAALREKSTSMWTALLASPVERKQWTSPWWAPPTASGSSPYSGPVYGIADLVRPWTTLYLRARAKPLLYKASKDIRTAIAASSGGNPKVVLDLSVKTPTAAAAPSTKPTAAAAVASAVGSDGIAVNLVQNKPVLATAPSAPVSANGSALAPAGHTASTITAAAAAAVATAGHMPALASAFTRLPFMPPAFREIVSLNTLRLDGNPLYAVPLAMLRFKALNGLSLKATKLMVTRPVVELLTAAQWALRLSSLAISHNPGVFASFSNELPAELGRFEGLRAFEGAGCGLVAVSPQLLSSPSSWPTSLESLVLDGNELHELPSFAEMTALTTLSLGDNKLASMPPLPPSLRALNLRNNRFVRMPLDGVDQLAPSLRELNLSGNVGMTTDPAKLAVLTNLRELLLANVGLAGAVPADWRRLVHLEVLDLSQNSLTSLPGELFTGSQSLRKLRKLVLSENQLHSLPFEISGAVSLEELHLANNNLEGDLAPAVGKLTSLRVLDVSNNRRLVSLPASMGFLLGTLQQLALAGTTSLRTPPKDVVVRGCEEVLSFLKDLLAGETQVFRMKLMVVGLENMGKTSLVRALTKRKPKKQLLSTDGINVREWTLPNVPIPALEGAKRPITLSLWDFAGQELYYTTHQFFLSQRSLYLVVWNATKREEDSRVEYWLHSVNSRAPGCPVLLVGTHSDDPMCTREYLAALQARLESRYSKRFPNIVGYHFVACPNGTVGVGIDKLRAEIEGLVASQPHMGEAVPQPYLQLEEAVRGQRGRRVPPVIGWRDFAELAALFGIRDDAMLLRATQWLHDLGSLIFFPRDERLNDMVLLDPQWLIDTMSTLITTKHNYGKNTGVINHPDLHQIWREPDYPPSLHDKLLYLLQKFEICFTFPGKDASLIPSLLPTERPTAALEGAMLSLRRASMSTADGPLQYGRRYLFEFVPNGFFSRLIVRLLHDKNETDRAVIYWRHGILLESGHGPASAQVLVELQPNANILDVTFRGGSASAHISLAKVVHTIDVLIDDWFKLQRTVLVPCTHCVAAGHVDDPYFFPLEACEAAAMKATPFLECMRNAAEPGQNVRVDQLVPQLAMTHFRDVKVDFANEISQGELIGEGGFARVYRALFRRDAATPKEVAVKVLRVDDEADGDDSLTADELAERDRERLKAFAEFRREVWLLSGLHHPNIVSMLGFCMHPLAIVTEFLHGGNLYDLIHFIDSRDKALASSKKPVATNTASNSTAESTTSSAMTATTGSVAVSTAPTSTSSTTSRSEARALKNAGLIPGKGIYVGPHPLGQWELKLRIALDTARGCAFLHRTTPPVLHRDLKSPNILLAVDWKKHLAVFAPPDGTAADAVTVSTEEKAKQEAVLRELARLPTPVAKVTDFGTSQAFASTTGRAVDNPMWLAPEVMRGEEYGTKADVYSFAVILYELATLKVYFSEYRFMTHLEQAVLRGDRPALPDPGSDELAREFYALIAACWAADPKARPEFAEVVERLQTMIAKHLPNLATALTTLDATGIYAEANAKENTKEASNAAEGNSGAGVTSPVYVPTSNNGGIGAHFTFSNFSDQVASYEAQTKARRAQLMDDEDATRAALERRSSLPNLSSSPAVGSGNPRRAFLAFIRKNSVDAAGSSGA